jgi:hypothetical protein
MLKMKHFLIISVVCTSFVAGCFSSGTAKKDEKNPDETSEALPLQLNDSPVQTNVLSAEDLNDDDKLQKVIFSLSNDLGVFRHIWILLATRRQSVVSQQSTREH